MLSRASLIVLFFCVFGTGLGLFSRHNSFEYYYHPDEYRKVRQLVTGERNIHHPMLMLTTVDVVRRAALRGSDKRDTQQVVVVGRWVTAAFAALTAAVLAILAARQYGLLAGWLTGILTLSNSLLFELAHYLKEDPYFAAGIACAALALHVYQRSPDKRSLLWLAAAAAMAAAGKFVGISLLPMMLIAVWRLPAGAGIGTFPSRLWRFLAVFVLVWLALNFPVLKNPSMMWHSISEEMDKAYGNELATNTNSLAFYLLIQEKNGGWVTPILSGLWLLWAVWRARRVTAAEWVLAGTSILYFIVFSLTPKDSSRYYLPIATSLCYFSVAGVMAWASEFRWKSLRWAAAALVLVAVGAQGKDFVKAWNGFKEDDREALEDWIAANLPPSAFIAQDETAGLPEPDRLTKKHQGRDRLPQKVTGADSLARLGTLSELKAKGVTHVAICYRTYGRYAEGRVVITDGSPAAAAQELYRTVNEKGKIIWEAPPGQNGYLQPGLRLIDITGIP